MPKLVKLAAQVTAKSSQVAFNKQETIAPVLQKLRTQLIMHRIKNELNN